MSQPGDVNVDENLTPEAAVKLAMEREQRANEFYRKCAATVKDPGVRKLFEFLAAEEQRHHDLLQRENDRFLAREN
jgi:rubrerythrin